MESPVRSEETGENGGGAGAGAGKDSRPGAAGGGTQQSAAAGADAFVAKSYLERQVEELSCADEDEAQEKVSKRLQFKQDQAQKKRWVLRCLFLLTLKVKRGEMKRKNTASERSTLFVCRVAPKLTRNSPATTPTSVPHRYPAAFTSSSRCCACRVCL